MATHLKVGLVGDRLHEVGALQVGALEVGFAAVRRREVAAAQVLLRGWGRSGEHRTVGGDTWHSALQCYLSCSVCHWWPKASRYMAHISRSHCSAPKHPKHCCCSARKWLMLVHVLPVVLLLVQLSLPDARTALARTPTTNLVGEVPPRHVGLSILKCTTDAKLPTGCSFVDVQVGQCRWAGQERS